MELNKVYNENDKLYIKIKIENEYFFVKLFPIQYINYYGVE